MQRILLVLLLVVASSGCGGHSTHAVRRTDAFSAYQSGRLGAMNLRIPYGTTAAQVLRQLGRPASTRNGCWLYRGRIGSIRGRFSGPYVDAVRFCFGEGPLGGKVVTQVLSHTPRHTIVRPDGSRRTYPAGWGPSITLIRPPEWYLRQSS